MSAAMHATPVTRPPPLHSPHPTLPPLSPPLGHKSMADAFTGFVSPPRATATPGTPDPRKLITHSIPSPFASPTHTAAPPLHIPPLPPLHLHESTPSSAGGDPLVTSPPIISPPSPLRSGVSDTDLFSGHSSAFSFTHFGSESGEVEGGGGVWDSPTGIAEVLPSALDDSPSRSGGCDVGAGVGQGILTLSATFNPSDPDTSPSPTPRATRAYPQQLFQRQRSMSTHGCDSSDDDTCGGGGSGAAASMASALHGSSHASVPQSGFFSCPTSPMLQSHRSLGSHPNPPPPRGYGHGHGSRHHSGSGSLGGHAPITASNFHHHHYDQPPQPAQHGQHHRSESMWTGSVSGVSLGHLVPRRLLPPCHPHQPSAMELAAFASLVPQSTSPLNSSTSAADKLMGDIESATSSMLGGQGVEGTQAEALDQQQTHPVTNGKEMHRRRGSGGGLALFGLGGGAGTGGCVSSLLSRAGVLVVLGGGGPRWISLSSLLLLMGSFLLLLSSHSLKSSLLPASAGAACLGNLEATLWSGTVWVGGQLVVHCIVNSAQAARSRNNSPRRSSSSSTAACASSVSSCLVRYLPATLALLSFLFQTCLMMYLAEAHAANTRRYALEGSISAAEEMGGDEAADVYDPTAAISNAAAAAAAVAAAASSSPSSASSFPVVDRPMRRLALMFPSASSVPSSDDQVAVAASCWSHSMPHYDLLYRSTLALQLGLWIFSFAMLLYRAQTVRDGHSPTSPTNASSTASTSTSSSSTGLSDGHSPSSSASASSSSSKRGLLRCDSCGQAVSPHHSSMQSRPSRWWWCECLSLCGMFRTRVLLCPSCLIMPLDARLGTIHDLAGSDWTPPPGPPFVSGEVLWYIAPAPLHPLSLSPAGETFFQQWLHHAWLTQIQAIGADKKSGPHISQFVAHTAASAAAADSDTSSNSSPIERSNGSTPLLSGGDSASRHLISSRRSSSDDSQESFEGGGYSLTTRLSDGSSDPAYGTTVVPGFEVIFRRYCDTAAAVALLSSPPSASSGSPSSSLSAPSLDGDCLVSLLHDLSSVLRTNVRFLRRAPVASPSKGSGAYSAQDAALAITRMPLALQLA